MTARGRRAGRGGRLLLAAVLLQPLAVLAAASTAGALPTPPPLPGPVPTPPPPSDPLIPPVGQQPGSVAPPCSAVPLSPTEIRTVYTMTDRHSSSAQQPASTFAVDPAAPCRLFRSLDHEVDRSDDSGHSFAPVFVDPASNSRLSAGPSVLSPVIPAGGQSVFLYDQSGTDGVFHSPDDGHTWDERDSGLYTASVQGPTGPTGGILAFAVAPSNPAVLYLVGTAGGQTVLFGSGNGGASWQVVGTPPSPQVTSISVDPGDPNHIFVAAGGPETAWGSATSPASSASTFYESADGGNNWASRNGPPNELSPTEILALRGSDGLRLYARTATLDQALSSVSGQKFWRSSDDGISWHTIAVPSSLGLDAAFAADPSNPDVMALAAAGHDANGHPGIAVVGTLDGFRTSRYARVIGTPGDVTAMEARADRSGDIFVQATYSVSGQLTDELLEFQVTALNPPPADNNNGHDDTPPLRECPLQAITTSGGLGGTQQVAVSYDAGSIAYDGRYLDYTQDEYAPGVIFRIDPTDCAAGPPLVLHAADTGGTLLALYALTFDPLYRFASGHVGAILARDAAGQDARVPSTDAAVIAVDPQTAGTELAGSVYCQLGAGHLPQCGQEDPDAFTFDPYLNQLWASIDDPKYDLAAGRVVAPHLGAARLQQVPTCMTNFTVPSGFSAGNDMSTWVTGGRDVMYVQMEDDMTVDRVDSATCRVLDSFQHANYGEGHNEDDQMACDSLTFGEGAPGVPAGTGTSALWLRNVPENVVRAYAVKVGFCPFPTQLSTVPAGTVQAGATVTLCAVLQKITGTGQPAPLPNNALQLTLGGKPIGVAVSDSTGHGCITTAAPATGGRLPLHASFAGNQQYMAADAEEVVDVLAPVPPPPNNGGNNLPPAPPHVPPAHAAPVPAAPPLAVQAPAQTQAQAQSQAQAQAQSQAQSQPAAALQRRTQARVALQRSDGSRTEMQLDASRTQLGWLVEAIALAMFAGGLAARSAHLRRRALRDGLRVARVPRAQRRGR